jgi:hypothetical protein
MTSQKQKLDDMQIRFARLAWLSLCLSILTGIAHVRAFPGYSAATSLVAIHASLQDNTNTDMLLRSNTCFGIIGGLTTLTDIVFCIIWAGEIQGYSGLVKLSFYAFISNIVIKGALLYSAMTVWVAASSTNPNEHDSGIEDEERMTPKRISPINDSFVLRQTPIGSDPALTPGGEMDEQLKGIPGLVSPGFDPRNRV